MLLLDLNISIYIKYVYVNVFIDFLVLVYILIREILCEF